MYKVRTFSDLLYEYQFALPSENRPHGSAMNFSDFSTTRQILANVLNDSSAVLLFRSILMEMSEVGPFHATKLNDYDVIDKLSQMLVLGRIKLYRRERMFFSFQERKPMVATPPPQPPQPSSSWIEVIVVWDETDQPVPDLQLVIETEDGQRNPKQTDPDGRVRLDQVVEGKCEVRCGISGSTIDKCVTCVGEGEKQAVQPKSSSQSGSSGQSGSNNSQKSTNAKSGKPLIIANIEKHKVKTGETLDDIAAKEGMPCKDLATFNWGTDNPDEINKHLAEDVGCTQKSEDGKDYIFDDSDDPGIIYIPKQWKYSAGTSIKHKIRVNWIEKVPVRIFRLKPMVKGKALANTEYTFKIGEVSKEGKTDKDGVLEERIPKKAKKGELVVIKPGIKYEINFDRMDTLDETGGMQARLLNLGFYYGKIDGDQKHSKGAILKFQQKNGLQATGDLTPETVDKIKSLYGI